WPFASCVNGEKTMKKTVIMSLVLGVSTGLWMSPVVAQKYSTPAEQEQTRKLNLDASNGTSATAAELNGEEPPGDKSADHADPRTPDILPEPTDTSETDSNFQDEQAQYQAQQQEYQNREQRYQREKSQFDAQTDATSDSSLAAESQSNLVPVESLTD